MAISATVGEVKVNVSTLSNVMKLDGIVLVIKAVWPSASYILGSLYVFVYPVIIVFDDRDVVENTGAEFVTFTLKKYSFVL